MNQDRRQIQEGMIAEAERALVLEKKNIEKNTNDSMAWGYCCYQEDWHQGLVGLVASRIKEKLHRPVIAFAKTETEELKGSGRSIQGLNIRDCLEQVSSRNPGLIRKFGGHAMAAGLSIDVDSYQAFSQAFDEIVRSSLSEQDLEEVVHTDGTLDPDSFTLNFAKYLEGLLPWGQGIPAPQFSGDFRVADMRWLKETHLKLKLTSDNQATPHAFDAIWFNAPTDIIEKAGDIFTAVYRLDINRYMNRESLQLQIVTGFS